MPASPSPSQPPVSLAAKVLVAEDDPVTARMIGDMLEGAGFAVVLAKDGAEALELAGQSSPTPWCST